MAGALLAEEATTLRTSRAPTLKRITSGLVAGAADGEKAGAAGAQRRIVQRERGEGEGEHLWQAGGEGSEY